MRYTSATLTGLLALAGGIINNHAATVGYWRFDEPGGGDGGAITTVVNQANPGTADATSQNAPLFSSTVPGTFIYDPISDTTIANSFSMDATGLDARVRALDASLDAPTSFTIKFFVRYVGEPTGFNAVVQKTDSTYNTIDTDMVPPDNTNLRKWQVDFSHNAASGTNGFGKIRSRWDTYDGATQTDFNVITRGDYVYVDTDGGTNDPNDYTQATGDVADEGDAVNDDPDTWHHVAMTYDNSTKEISMFTDYSFDSKKTLTGTFVQPDSYLNIGPVGTAFGLFIDEVRYTDQVLSTSEFLVATIPEPSRALLLALGLGAVLVRRRR